MISENNGPSEDNGCSVRERIATWIFLGVMYAIILSCPATIIYHIVKWMCRD